MTAADATAAGGEVPHAAAAGVALGGVAYAVGRGGNAVRLLDAVDAAFPRGRFTALLGPNGAGKSTLLRVATGLARPAAGRVTYGGRPLDAFAPAELARTRGVLSQQVTVAFPLTAAEVVLLGRAPHYARVPGPRDRAAADAALARVGLAARAAQAYATLSGGERQKVQLARVLAQLTDGAGARHVEGALRVLFLDEPTASLDVHDQLAVLDIARAFADAGGVVVAVLHDLNLALRYADGVVLLERGRVAYDGPGAALPPALVERVYRVRARVVADEDGSALWRFTR